MKLRSKVASALALFLLSFVLLSCSPLTAEPEKPTAEAAKVTIPDATPTSLPVQYQKPSYRVDSASKENVASQADDLVLKVGARISSTKKVALNDVIKPLAKLKKLNISWASDVIQNINVDVDIKADDDFYMAIEDLLRQVDYFYELKGSTLVIKYKETKRFHIAMPFTQQEFSVTTGGNALGGGTDNTVNQTAGDKTIEGTIKIASDKNQFDIWDNVKLNLDTILNLRTIRTTKEELGVKTTTKKEVNDISVSQEDQGEKAIRSKDEVGQAKIDAGNKAIQEEADRFRLDEEKRLTMKRKLAEPKGSYMVDKPIGLITVTAPRHVIKEVDAYMNSLQNEIYKQISIEAKIIEVQLTDDSSIGINWNSVLENFNIAGAVEFGAQTLGSGVTSVGQIFPYVFANENAAGTWNDGTNHGSTYDPTRFVSNVKINTANFDVFLNALKTQGNTKILSNPKISVLNGQPAMISVGRNVSYIKKVESKTDEFGNTSFTITPGSILSGVGLGLTATILDNNEIIMNLIPVTSELVEGTEKELTVAGEGATAIKMGLPIVNIREMSTIVRVKDGEMLVIGGLISDMDGEEGNFAPVVGDIPVLKYLFGYETKVKHKRELIILLKPRII
jgi:general secretion pathway protein D/MSHA biogenesis protein MshL